MRQITFLIRNTASVTIYKKYSNKHCFVFFSIGSTDQLWPVFEDYSKNIGKNMNALFFKLVRYIFSSRDLKPINVCWIMTDFSHT